MHPAALVARRIAGRRATALKVASRSYATPVATHARAEEDPQLAGYPQLPDVSKQYRNPKAKWDDWQMRRNFGETLHEKEELYSMWGPDIPVVPPQTALRHFTVAVLTFVTFGFVVRYALVPERPSIPREYPHSGLVTELGGLEENKVSDLKHCSLSPICRSYVSRTGKRRVSGGRRVILQLLF
ncbi:hypothetical protein BXZ70DRAFT_898103 [Cristinia sonorae]|uniref:Uncharacterized protein n=1 Tax=Cristinia sonorae TaxID=1940300 RepID=A0A8K0XM68_9AGAR|nr:hypothetical protein BXZ70DRAFT_898103 [Cristinia sonorae]